MKTINGVPEYSGSIVSVYIYIVALHVLPGAFCMLTICIDNHACV